LGPVPGPVAMLVFAANIACCSGVRAARSASRSTDGAAALARGFPPSRSARRTFAASARSSSVRCRPAYASSSQGTGSSPRSVRPPTRLRSSRDSRRARRPRPGAALASVPPPRRAFPSAWDLDLAERSRSRLVLVRRERSPAARACAACIGDLACPTLGRELDGESDARIDPRAAHRTGAFDSIRTSRVRGRARGRSRPALSATSESTLAAARVIARC